MSNQGYRGVYQDRSRPARKTVWRADVCVNGKRLRKRFATREEAKAWYAAQLGKGTADEQT